MNEHGSTSVFDDLTQRLRDLRISAGEPSFSDIARRVTELRNAAGASPWEARPGRVTIYDAFKTGRKRIDIALLLDIVTALGYPEQREAWRADYQQALRARAGGAARPRIELVRPVPPGALHGREAELAELLTALLGAAGPAAEQGTAPVSALISGLAGCGKTALARTLTQELADRLPGAFAVEASLRTASGDDAVTAATPSQIIVAVEPLLIRATRAEGAPAPRCILLVDDALTAQDLAELTQGLPARSILVATSRRNLAVPDAVTHLRLSALAPAFATQVLRAGLPPERITDADEATLARLAQRCGGLPLALTILRGQILAHPTWTLTDIEHWLPHAGDQVDGFLAAVHDRLEPPARRALSLCAIHPARLTTTELAALLGVDEELAQERVALLLREHLLTQQEDGRLDVHDLVRAFALRRSLATEPFSHVRLSVGRLAQLLLTSAEAETAPFDWLEERVEVIVTTAQLAADHDLPQELTSLADLVHVHLRRTMRDGDSLIILDAARRHGVPQQRREADRRYLQILIYQKQVRQAVELGQELVADTEDPGRAHSMVLLAESYRHASRYDEAVAIAQEVLRTSADDLDPFAAGVAAVCLTVCHLRALQVEPARTACSDGLARLSLPGYDDPHMRATLLFHLAWTYQLQAQWDRAEELTHQSLALARSLSRHDLVEICLSSLGASALHRGDIAEALELLHASVERALPLGETFILFDATRRLGLAMLAAGRLDEAAALLARARDLADHDDVPQAQAALGDLALARGDVAQAREHYRAVLATPVGDVGAQQLALRGLGDVALAEGDEALARQTWQDALALDPPQWFAHELRQRLT